MTIKSENKDTEQLRWCEKVKKFFKDYSSEILTILFYILMISVAFNIIKWLVESPGKDLAKELVKKDYPAVLCLSNNGSFRVYESKTYTVHKHKDNGWNIYWTKDGSNESSAFHLTKCEIK